ncbi:RNA methyltransferase [Thermosynechococcus sp. HN-54]|uniref:TrmH family RNA methyltransferase n=1 Tax=Thermosynechococcus sp. HN-54 TaxID=2933959 RepID=UPI00202CBA79|nr:RNA methyltransferase [Thermosynechococcus sp. HN-54]URR36676.1 RNA methyltransferase [Thermosynechococcus sp. HN-54]
MIITSRQNPLVRSIRKLHHRKYRQGHLLLEGTHLLQEAVAGGYHLSVVCYTSAWQAKQSPTFWQQVVHRSDRTVEVTEEVLTALCTTTTPDGVVAVADYTPLPTLPLQRLGLCLVTLQDPGNLGTIIRTAAAVGVEGLLLTPDCVDMTHPKVLRASAGQWFRLPMQTITNGLETLKAYQAQGWQIVVTLPTAPCVYWQADFRRPTLLVMGNEGQGLPPAYHDSSFTALRIPQEPNVESLNVAIATAVLLYEVYRQRSLD